MRKYKVKILRKEWIAEGVLATYLEKPKGFRYTAGQYTQVWLSRDPNDSRTFSIASAPYEKHLMFAMRIPARPSAFKRKLSALRVGSVVTIEDGAGDFVLPRGKQSFVFLVGGMGMTAVRSMVRAELKKRSPRPMQVFFWTRTRSSSPFFDEMSQVASSRYRFIPYITARNGRRLSAFRKELHGLHSSYFFVVAPPGFVVWMTTILERGSIPPTHIKAEEYSGY
jgi:ferredoxin-NADP reductase